MTTKTVEQLLIELDALEREGAEITRRISGIKQQIVDLSTPLRAGDRVEYIAGSSKPRVFELTRVVPGIRNNPKFIGRLIKKDGSIGVLESELYIIGDFYKIRKLP